MRKSTVQCLLKKHILIKNTCFLKTLWRLLEENIFTHIILGDMGD